MWGLFDKDILEYQFYQVFFYGDIRKTYFVDIQSNFKDWYDRIYSHNRYCRQILDVNDIDGPMCSCLHRPYKYSTDQWSMSNTLTYTLNQFFACGYNPVEICLAITKLSRVVEEN